MPSNDEELAALLLETVPLLMGDIRERMGALRVSGEPRLGFEHHRVLGYVGRHEGTSLSQLAGALGLSMPAASKIVQALVDDELITRESDPDDRRAVRLAIGPKARLRWEQVRKVARESLSERLASLKKDDRDALIRGLRAVREALAATQEAPARGPRS